MPSPSPDGLRVAYRAQSGDLRILDVITGSEATIRTSTSGPAWSPVADEIVVNEGIGKLVILRSDGTVLRTLANTIGIEGSLQWSSDGRWLLGSMPGLIVGMIDVQSDQEMPLSAPSFGATPAWKP
jgi:Tol biopolymer transport system component